MTMLVSSGAVRGRTVIVQAAEDFVRAAGPGWLDRIMTEVVTDKLHEKQGRSIARWTLPNADLTVFLKRHYVLPRWRGVCARLFPQRAWSPGLQEWQHLEWAVEHGIPVARPVAAAEWRGPRGRLQSFLAVEELANCLPLHEAIPHAAERLNAREFRLWKRRLVAELARLTVELHRQRAFHEDLYLCHFYLDAKHCERRPESFRGRVVMIDFHRLGLRTWTARWFQVKDLAQLLFSTRDVAAITDRDRRLFWLAYRRAMSVAGRPVPAWVGTAAELKCRNYTRHNRKHTAKGRP